MNNYLHVYTGGVIIHLCHSFNDGLKLGIKKCNYIKPFYMDVIKYPCNNTKLVS